MMTTIQKLLANSRHSVRVTAVGALALLTLATTLAGCGTSANGAGGSPTKLTVGLTYVPNIQFAPFYVAQALGYYRDAGLDITFHHHGASEDEFGALVAGQEDAIFASGDEIAGARAHNVPIVDVATVFTRYPVVVIVPASSSIQSAADLRGHTIGVPGAYGATYIGLLSLLASAGLSKNDVTIQSIGYTQAPALLSHKVDAVMGYANNEPLLLKKAGMDVRTLDVNNSEHPLVSNGLAAMEPELASHGDAIKKLVAATLKGVDYVLAHPQEAVNLSKQFVPGLSDASASTDALAVLQATLPYMQTVNGKPGYNDPAKWSGMISFLQSQGQLAGPVDASKAYSNSYLP
ncbi:MAG TPA: ABC transporter substrate-binding protein [Ktedonobacterales bacterium]|nr:ABC transporter substrate-binding protein [Ktedonobacterales bacterium]